MKVLRSQSPESQDEHFAGRVQFDKDVLREGRIRLHVSRLRTDDSGLYLCEVKTNYGFNIGKSRLNVTGYVILVLIIVMIIVLCVILYILRRVSRMYSFDLQRPSPVDRLSEPIGTFEPVYLDDLAPQEQPDANGVESSPAGNASPSEGDDPADKRSSLLGSTNLFFDITGEEQQNGNNNNP
ncbi:hypothetical protein L3Q82_016592 [Scortum barcoo]|uniref:Uncharacterized protein n=1 Tax=Scortum barcoo TaxID=214431 RepID=A0ACB8X7G3_9TELE|nr:hypothetical protein L3Q82_016592 [Scortum barcoo]